jgi:hypothetical protein
MARGKEPEEYHPIIDATGLKKELAPDQTRKVLNMDSAIESLFASLTSSEDGTIKSLYSRLVDEQKGTVPNLQLIDQLKAELMGAYMSHYKELEERLNQNISDKFNKYFQSQSINLRNLPKAMLGSITNLMTQQLTSNVEENKFRLSVWLDYISLTRNALKKLL